MPLAFIATNRKLPPTMPAAVPETVRLDKWLWAVRLFKTRTLAAEACAAGHVKLDDQRVKPARSVHPGETYHVRNGDLVRIVKVLAPLAHRVSASLVPQYLEDLTPPPQRPPADGPSPEPLFHRPRGAGRPTKRDRRLLEQLGFQPDPE